MVHWNALALVVCVYPTKLSLLKVSESKECAPLNLIPSNLSLESFLYITTLLLLVLNIDAEQPEL